jgi:hypothetical protein
MHTELASPVAGHCRGISAAEDLSLTVTQGYSRIPGNSGNRGSGKREPLLFRYQSNLKE